MDISVLPQRVTAGGLRRLTSDRLPVAKAPLCLSGIVRILVCRTSRSLGNTLLVTPLLQEIELIWPGAEIDIVTRSQVAQEIFASYPGVCNIFRLPRRTFHKPMLMLKTLQRMYGQRYDLAIDTDPRSRTGRFLLARANARHKIGFVTGSKRDSVTHGVGMESAPTHAGQIPVFLLRSALQHRSIGYPALSIRLAEDEREQGRQILARITANGSVQKKKGTIGIFANATGHKLLDRDWWRAFMPVIEAGYPDFSFVEILPADGVSMLDSRYANYYTSNVRKLAQVLCDLSMLICLDCGIMHLARASGTRTAAVFTVTDAMEWGPYGQGAHVVDGRGCNPEEAAQRLLAMAPADSLTCAR